MIICRCDYFEIPETFLNHKIDIYFSQKIPLSLFMIKEVNFSRELPSVAFFYPTITLQTYLQTFVNVFNNKKKQINQENSSSVWCFSVKKEII